MHICQACKRPENNAYLCNDCTTTLANMLDEIPWLLKELDARIQKLDRVPNGTIGRTRRPDELSVIDFDAAEDARNVRKLLRHWVETITQRHGGRIPPGLDTVATRDLAIWLRVNLPAIRRLDLADNHGNHQLYNDIEKLVGSSQKGGKLVAAINRTERHFAGPCPTVIGHNNRGEAVTCGENLYADIDDRSVTCPKCQSPIDVQRNQRQVAADRDLMTIDQLVEVLDTMDEHVPRATIERWVRARRLRNHGYLHNGAPVRFHIRRTDPALYSLKRARYLRDRDQQLRRTKTTT